MTTIYAADLFAGGGGTSTGVALAKSKSKADRVTGKLRWFVCPNGHRYKSSADKPYYGMCPECKSVGVLEGYIA